MAKGEGRQFVVQKHDARRLHFDLRLELDGVLLSWACPNGPSNLPTDKRLAVRTEDHPLKYLEFEGSIPKGEYGGGTMIVWDRGNWEPVYDPHKSLAKGHLEFALVGHRLKGRWHLVRMKPRPKEKKEQWLLIKADDEYARANSRGSQKQGAGCCHAKYARRRPDHERRSCRHRARTRRQAFRPHSSLGRDSCADRRGEPAV
jgi:DNA ligase D-like protein (predicted 3'-phosphoesterase)